MLETVAALQTYVLIPLCDHALRDLKALPPSSPASPAGSADSAGLVTALASAVRADGAAAAVATGELRALVFAPQTLPAADNTALVSSGHPPGDSPGSPLSAAVGRARRVTATDLDDASPEDAANDAAQQANALLPARVRRVQVLLRDLFEVLDFTCAVVLGGSLRYNLQYKAPRRRHYAAADETPGER